MKARGEAAFDVFYRALWGERWDGLKAALCRETRPAAYTHKLIKPYFLDAASIGAAELLPQGARCVLDACAAPGGKSLVIASRLAPDAALVCNELSAPRRSRLVRVLNEHLPPDIRGRVTVSGFDAAARAADKREHGRFDAILLDAPCSSERHVLTSPTHLTAWTPARPPALARRQWALLSSAFLLLKAGGLLVYATCSINPAENEGVLSRLFAKYGASATLAAPPTLTLPDTTGSGPLFCVAIQKLD